MGASTAANTPFFDAFISYGRADSKQFATQLYQQLLERGFAVWFDQNDIPLGVDFQAQIDDGLEKAHNFLFIIAPHSVNSPYCGKEIELALKRNKRIIPLLHVEQINRETWQNRHPDGTDEQWVDYQSKGLHSSFPNMHPEIGKINWVYFREGVDDFERSLQGLIEIFQRHQGYVEQHTILLAKALEWERNQKQTRHLLLGEERQQAENWLRHRFKEEQAPCKPTSLHCEFICESIKNANNLMTQVFLAYADKDRTLAEQIRSLLLRQGITVWISQLDIQTGETFEEAIERGIEQADTVVYLLSPASSQSDYCQRELDYALSLNKRIIPLLIQATGREQIPSSLRSLQFIDFTDNTCEADYQQDIDQLLRVLQEDVTYYEDHKQLLTKALKWERQGRNPTILLRGYNLRRAEDWLKGARHRSQYRPTRLQETFITESLRQPPAGSLDVFISYSRADSELARQVNDELQVRGKTTWFDQESIAAGADFQQEIYQGIEIADNFLFILSPRSTNSPYCDDEVEYAAKLNKRFVTLLHCPINTTELHPELARVQWIDFTAGDFFSNLNRLIRTLETDREHVHNHTKWSLRALEWQSKDRNEDMLLRGIERVTAESWLQEAMQSKKQPTPTELQQAFITTSIELHERLQQQQKERQQRELNQAIQARKAAQRRNIVLRACFVVAVGSAIYAYAQQQKATVERDNAEINFQSATAQNLLASNLHFEAILSGLKVGQKVKRDQKLWTDTRMRAIAALQEVVYGNAEENRLEGHQSRVRGLSFSPNGKLIATASYDNTVKLWTLQGQELRTFVGHHGLVHSVNFSPDGKTIATASEDKTVKLWNLQGKELQVFKGHRGAIREASFSPDGKTIATASYDGTARLWNLQGKELLELKGHSPVWSVSFSPDGKTIATASDDSTVKLWNLKGQELKLLKGHRGPVWSVSFSPDGKTIATASDDSTVKLWNLKGQALQTFKGHLGTVWSVRFSPDGKTIATVSNDGTLRVWRLKNQEQVVFKGHGGAVYGVSFSPDGKTIATGGNDNTARLWTLHGQKLQLCEGHRGTVRDVSFSPDGKTIVSASEDTTAQLWDLQGKKLQTFKGHRDTVRSASFSADGKTIATASYDNTVKLWNLQGQELQTFKKQPAPVYRVRFSPDGQMIATSSKDGTAKLWTLQGRELQIFKGHDGEVNDVSFSPDGQTIATASDDQTAILWNLQGKKLKILKGHHGSVFSVSFSPDGKTIATASKDKTIKLWNLKGQELTTFTGHRGAVFDARFSPDGKTIVSASEDGTVKLWNLEGQQLQTFQGHENLVRSVSFSPDGKTIASASYDRTIILWNLDLDDLLQRGCAQLHDYLTYNPNGQKERQVCDGISKPVAHIPVSNSLSRVQQGWASFTYWLPWQKG